MDAAEAIARVEIRAVAERYFSSVDGSDGNLMASCFAKTFRFELDMRPTRVMTKHDEVRAFLNESWRPAASTHALGNMDIALEGDRARSIINAVIHVLLKPGGTVLNRGIRYTDRWIKEDGAWAIAERVHSLRWHYETEEGGSKPQ